LALPSPTSPSPATVGTGIDGRRALDGGDGMRLHFGVLNTTVTDITVTITTTVTTITVTAPA